MVQKLNNGNAQVNDDGTFTLVGGTLDGSEGGGGGLTPKSFSVHKNGTNQTGIEDSVWTKLTWSTEEWDVGGDFASDKFTPQVAGKYTLITGCTWQGIEDGAQMHLAIYKNGGAYKRMIDTVGSVTSQGPGMIADVIANGSTDYFEVWATHDVTGDQTILGNAELTFFQGHIIEED